MLINVYVHSISKRSLKVLVKLPFVKGILKTQNCFYFLVLSTSTWHFPIPEAGMIALVDWMYTAVLSMDLIMGYLMVSCFLVSSNRCFWSNGLVDHNV